MHNSNYKGRPKGIKEKKPRRFAYLTQKDMVVRLKQLGLPYHPDTLLRWKKKGWIEARTSPGGWFIYKNRIELDMIISKMLKKRGTTLPGHFKKPTDPIFKNANDPLRAINET